MTIQEKLELSVAIRGVNDPLTLILSRQRDVEVTREQLMYNKLKEEGKLREMAREYHNPTRQQEIFEIIRRVEEM